MILGDGQRLLDASLGLGPDEGIELTTTRVIEAPDVTHVRYAVNGRARLHLDDDRFAAVAEREMERGAGDS